MQPRTYVANFSSQGVDWQILTIVYEDGSIHQAVRHTDWETWSPPLQYEVRP